MPVKISINLAARPCAWVGHHADYIAYHDYEWGVACYHPQQLFEKLCLEGQQAGLSWLTILRKRDHYRRCFYNFNPTKIATMDDAHLYALSQDTGLIRHLRKLTAIRTNARAYLALTQQGIDFATWLWQFVDGKPIIHHYQHLHDIPTQTAASHAMSRALKQAGFVFVGPTICYAFMQSMGMVNDHLISCPSHPEYQHDDNSRCHTSH